MPMKVKTAGAATAVLPHISSELLDQIVTGPMTQQGIEEAMRGLKKALIERALGAEMSHHLGYASVADARTLIASHIDWYNDERQHEPVRNFVFEA